MLFPGGFYYLVLKPRLGLIIIVVNFTKDILKEPFIKIKEKEFSKLLAIKSKVKPPFWIFAWLGKWYSPEIMVH